MTQELHTPGSPDSGSARLGTGRLSLDHTQLIDRCRQGDDQAWEAIVRRYQGRVFAVAFHYLRDREEARDTAQDIFVKVYQQIGGLREGDAFLPWLLRMARNSCIDRLRSDSRAEKDQVP